MAMATAPPSACRSLGDHAVPCFRPAAARRRAPVLVPHASIGKRTAVQESLTLLRFPDDCALETVSDVVDRVWSMQYVAAGPVCGSAGPLLPLPGAPATLQPPPFTHAVLFRYGNRRNLDTFLDDPKVETMLSTTAAAAAEGVATLCFEGAVPNELESIFRRGAEWEEGQEVVLALQRRPEAAEGDAEEFLGLTQQIATSSAFGAVQATCGQCFALQHHAGGEAEGQATLQPDFILLVRFQGKDQAAEFAACPPVAALLEGDERAPLRALWGAVLEVAPSDRSNSSQQGRGGLL